jgi:pantetheine-phosphate adenylyltransferase
MKTCVYPGSFDPFTNGHLDIALRAGDLFDKVVILISQNPGKGERFLPAREMQDAIRASLAIEGAKGRCPRTEFYVDILNPEHTVLDYMSNHREYLENCMNIIRGIRNATDATDELNLADQYKWFSHMIRFEFIPLIAKPAHRSISSSLVREMVKYLPPDEIPVPEPVAVLMSKEGK